jgi:RHS repeat-associated protein
VLPALIGVGDLVTATLVVQNEAPYAADDLVVSMPLPAEAVAADRVGDEQGWRWEVGTLAPRARTTLTATMRLSQFPQGRALLLRPQATAKGVATPITTLRGTLATDDRAALPLGSQVDGPLPTVPLATVTPDPLPSPVEVPFVPGQATRLTSRDGLVQVEVPADAADQALTLSLITRGEQERIARRTATILPPEQAGFYRGFGAFFLEAKDVRGQDVHRFKAPLTVSLAYTDAQLAALGIAPNDLRLFWFDETRTVGDGKTPGTQGQWVQLPTHVNTDQRIASAQTDHFTGFQFSDATSPSTAFIPSLQGWQVDGFTGAVSFQYPFELPAGPAGIKPDLALSYSSAATDGFAGQRQLAQSSWVGKGWNLEPGSIAMRKIASNGSADDAFSSSYFALTLNGRSYDVIRGSARAGITNPSIFTPSDWNWQSTDESFLRIQVEPLGPSTGSRGGFVQGNAQPRYKWLIWDKSGTRYEFSEDAWWGWEHCTSNGMGEYGEMEAYQWFLKSITDTHGNTITYNYLRQSTTTGPGAANGEGCGAIWGTIDSDVWLSEITWADGRYRVWFETDTARGDDALYEFPPDQYVQPPHKTQRLIAVHIESKPTTTWEPVRTYALAYETAATAILQTDKRCNYPTCTGYMGFDFGPWPGRTKLTLKSIQRFDKTGAYTLPPLTFSYHGSLGHLGGTDVRPQGGWNRLTRVNNGQGGTIFFEYQHIGTGIDEYAVFDHYHRVLTKTLGDGLNNQYTYSYSYTDPAITALGRNLGYTYLPSNQMHPNSATLYYNTYLNPPYGTPETLAHPDLEFRGHATMTEAAPDGSRTKHYFYQGDAGCTPNASALQGSHAIITADPNILDPDRCFVRMRDQEILKGREYKTEHFGLNLGGSLTLLASTERAFNVEFFDYSWDPDSGLWRSFSYEKETTEKQWDGATSSSKRTEYFYSVGGSTEGKDADNNGSADNPTDCASGGLSAYGNLGCIKEYDQNNNLIRVTRREYVAPPTTAYIVDKAKRESIFSNTGGMLARSDYFYDSANTFNYLSTTGELRLERKYYSTPSSCCTSTTLYGRDTAYTYDTFGNPTLVQTFPNSGRAVYNATNDATYSAQGNGTTPRTTTTAYETTFNTFPIQITNPLGHVQTAAYDYRMGTLIKIVGPNTTAAGGPTTNCAATSYTIPATEETTCAQYDGFGRMVGLVRPGDTSQWPTILPYYADNTYVPGDTKTLFRYSYSQLEVSGTTQYRINHLIYDGLGRKIQIKNESNDVNEMIVTTMQYDGLSRVYRQSQPRYVAEGSPNYLYYTAPIADALMNWTTNTYDGLGRTLTTTMPDGTKATNHYGLVNSAAGQLRYHDIIDSNRHRIQYQYDSLGRMTGVDELVGNCALNYWLSEGFGCDATHTVEWAVQSDTRYTYTRLDLLATATDDKGNVTTLTYDRLGRKTDMVDPDMGTWMYGYDPNGNLTFQEDGKDRRICFYYDNLDRLTGKHERNNTACPTNGTLYASYTYDLGTYGRGQRTGMTATGGASTTWTYDARGRVDTATHTVPGLNGSRVFDWGYDSGDRITTLRFPTQRDETVTYSYDPAWRQISACSSLGGCYAAQAQYNARNQATQLDFGNTARMIWDYNNATTRLAQLRTGSTATPSQFFDRSYQYDNVGNVKTITDNRAGGNPLQSYGYDDRDRLTSWTLGGTTENYTYDTIGNLLTKAGVAYANGSSGNGTGTRPHAPKTVGGAAYTYDNNGNLLTGGGRTYVWNMENFPTSITASGTTETYAYNADSQRVTRTRSGVTTVYLEGIWEEVASTTLGDVTKYITLQGQTVARRAITAANSTTYRYIHNDPLGSVSVVTGFNAPPAQSGTTLEYDPWGKVRSGSNTATKRNYTGHYLDDTGLIFANARYYDPNLAKFVSADTIVPGSASGSMSGVAVKPLTVGFHENQFLNKVNSENRMGFWFQLDRKGREQMGNPMGPMNPQALNRYAYAQNNPMKWTDPTGHDPGERSAGGYSYSHARGANYGEEYQAGGYTYKVGKGKILYRETEEGTYYLMRVCITGQGCKYVDSSSANFSQFKSAVDNIDFGIKAAFAAGLTSVIIGCAVSGVAGCVAGILIGLGVGLATYVFTLIYWSDEAQRAFDSIKSIPPKLVKPSSQAPPKDRSDPNTGNKPSNRT